MRNSIIWTEQNRTEQNSTAQHSTAQHSTAQHRTEHKAGFISGLLEYRTMIGSVCIISRNGDNMNALFCWEKDCKEISGDAYG